MISPEELRQEAREFEMKAKAIIDGAEASDDALTEEQSAKATEYMDKAEANRADADKIEAAEQLKARVLSAQSQVVEPAVVPTASLEIPDRSRVEGGEPQLAKDPKGGFKTFNGFCKAVRDVYNPTLQVYDERLKMIEAVAGGGRTYGGEEGGFLIPADFSNRLYSRDANPELPILGMTDRITLTGDSIEITAIADKDRSAAASRHGGVVVYWVKEAGQITKSSLKTRQIKLDLNKVAALSYATEEELQSVANHGERLLSKMNEALIEEITEQILFGTGSGKPLGMLNAANSSRVSTSIETGQTGTAVIFENLVNMWARGFKPGRSVWIYNNEVFPGLALMKLDVGTGGGPVFMPSGGASATPYSTLFGRPAYMTDHCSAVGTVGDIGLIDPSAYIVATKGTADRAISIHLAFDYAQTAFRMMFRIDGTPLWDSALTPRKGSNTLSPFVTLATRS